jgi:hypothetical protein
MELSEKDRQINFNKRQQEKLEDFSLPLVVDNSDKSKLKALTKKKKRN